MNSRKLGTTARYRERPRMGPDPLDVSMLRLSSDVCLDRLTTGEGHVYGPAWIGRNTGRCGVGIVRRNKCDDPAILGAPDPSAGFPTGAPPITGVFIRHVQHVVRVNEQSAGRAELSPLVQEFAFLIED